MSDREVDRRIKRTKKLLREALTAMMAEKKLRNISIRELCDYADISRGTFYLHYTDISDMVGKIEKELFEGLEIALDKKLKKDIAIEDVHSILIDIYQDLSQHSEILVKLLGPNGDATLLNKVKDFVRDKCLHSWMLKLEENTTPASYYLNTFIVSGIVGIITEWLSSGMKETPEEIADITVQVMRGLND